MKFRSWWLAIPILILLGGICVVIIRSGEESGNDNSRESPKSTVHKRSDGRKQEKTRHTLKMPLVSRFGREGKLPELTDEQVARFLEERNRNPESLLAVFRLKGDLSLLHEAAKAFPDHPMVQLELAMSGATPEEKQLALEAFRKLQPNDSMGDYLAALFLLRQGKPEEAFKELSQAESHSGFGEGSDRLIQSSEDAFVSAGYGVTEAKCAALLDRPRTQTMTLNQLTGILSGLHQQYLQEGDSASAEAVFRMGLSLSRKVRDQSKLLLDDLVGVSMESRFLKQLPVETELPGSGQTAASRLEELTAQRQELSALAEKSAMALAEMSEGEVLTYIKRVGQDGEVKALEWLNEKQGR